MGSKQPLSSSAASPEAVWGAAFEEVCERMGPIFARSETRERAQAYLCGLLSPVERKNGGPLAEEAGEATPYAMQYLLDRARWESDCLTDEVRAYVREKLADPEAVLVIDETGFVKKGMRVGVSAAAVQRHGRAHRELPIGCLLVVRQPEGPHFTGSGTVSAQELDAASGTLSGSGCAHRGGVCPAFQSWRHACVFCTLDAEVPACWVTGDTVYGSHRPLRAGLEARKQAYALAVSCQEHVELAGKQQRVDQLAQEVAPEAWQRLSAGAGSKGPRLYDWARLELSSPAPAGWERWLVIRRSIAVGAKPPKMAYVLVFARTGTTLQEIVLTIANASVVMTTHRRINRRAPGIRLSRNFSAEPEPNVLPYPSSSI